MYQSKFIKQVEVYKGDEIYREVSVYRYRVQQQFQPTLVHQKIDENRLTKGTFGIMEVLPTRDASIRTLWAKLGERTLPVVDEDGYVTFWNIERVMVSSAVVEFFNDNDQLGLIIFGGSKGIHNDLISTLEKDFGFKNFSRQRMQPEQLRNIFNRYWRKLKKISLDPSNDLEWGGVGDAKLSSRGKYINVEANLPDVQVSMG